MDGQAVYLYTFSNIYIHVVKNNVAVALSSDLFDKSLS